MQCTLCKNGTTVAGTTTVTLHQENCTVIVKDVPADICANCGEYYLTQEMTQKLLTLANEAARHGAEVEILRFAA